MKPTFTPDSFKETKPEQETPTEEKVSVVSIVDIRIQTIDEESRKILGSVDLRTDPYNGSWSEVGIETEYKCMYRNFFLGINFAILNAKPYCEKNQKP